MLPKKWNRKWKVHERVQRTAARGVFLLAGIAPIACILIWIGLDRLPWVHAKQITMWEQQLANDWLMDVAIENVTHPRPHTYHLTQISLKHPETGREAAHVSRAELQYSTKGWQARLYNMEVDAEESKRLTKLLHDRLVCTPRMVNNRVSLEVDSIHLKHTRDYELKNIQVYIQSSREATLAKVELQSPNELDTNSRCELQIKRIHRETDDSDAPAFSTYVRLDTRRHMIPCAWLNEFLIDSTDFGPRAGFAGVMSILHEDGNRLQASPTWMIDNGEFVNAEWQNITQSLPWLVAGQARIQIDQARFTNGRLTSGTGTLFGSNGYMGQPAANELVNQLGLRIADAPITQTLAGHIRYHQFAVRFALDANGLQLEGVYPRDERAQPLVFLDSSTPWLFEPASRKIPASQCDRLLASLTQQNLPTRFPQTAARNPSPALATTAPLPTQSDRPPIRISDNR